MAKHRNVRKLKEVLLNTKLTCQQMDLILYTVPRDPEASTIIDTAGMSKPSISTEIDVYYHINQKEIIEHTLETNHINGRINDDKRSFIESNLVVCVPSL